MGGRLGARTGALWLALLLGACTGQGPDAPAAQTSERHPVADGYELDPVADAECAESTRARVASDVARVLGHAYAASVQGEVVVETQEIPAPNSFIVWARRVSAATAATIQVEVRPGGVGAAADRERAAFHAAATAEQLAVASDVPGGPDGTHLWLIGPHVESGGASLYGGAVHFVLPAGPCVVRGSVDLAPASGPADGAVPEAWAAAWGHIVTDGPTSMVSMIHAAASALDGAS